MLWDLVLKLFLLKKVHMSLVNSARNPQVWISTNFSLKLGPTALFTHLKIILLQYFQFSIISNKRYPNKPLVENRHYINFHTSNEVQDRHRIHKWMRDLVGVSIRAHQMQNATLLCMCLDTAYFTKNWKLKTENNKMIFLGYCSLKRILCIVHKALD